MIRFCLFVFLTLSSVLHASVETSTSISPMGYRSSESLGGSISFTVSGEDFRDVSPGDPFFVRISLDNSVTLASTLVEQSSSNPVINQPINLAMRGGSKLFSVVAQADAVRIVRWVAGESELWLEVQQSSDQWLSMGGSLFGPDRDRPVSFGIGISARISDGQNQADGVVPLANIPFNTRSNTSAEGDYADAVSTNLCLNASASNLTADGTRSSLLAYDVIAYADADLGGGVYSSQAGNDTGINFYGSINIGRGQNKTYEQSDVSLGANSGGINGSLATVQQAISSTLSCVDGGKQQITELYPGTSFTLNINTANAGFPASSGAAFATWPGTVEINNDSSISVDGVTLYQELTLVYTGALVFASSLQVDQLLELWYSPASGPDFELVITASLASHDGATDDAPYGGADQNRLCEPSATILPSVNFTVSAPLAVKPRSRR